ncbi:MAG: hypothetical protein Fur0032_08170 [Terrimicrobiaceae bacterium]
MRGQINFATKRFPNFSFHIALSSPLPEEDWHGLSEFIHDVAEKKLAAHPESKNAEYDLRGPTQMIKFSKRMLRDLGVTEIRTKNKAKFGAKIPAGNIRLFQNRSVLA